MSPSPKRNCKTYMQRTEAGELEIKPKTSAAEWVRWMENMQDWCISRQLWWGHRCPAYLIKFDGEAADVRHGH
jgi:valyl-tRNA synthetase